MALYMIGDLQGCDAALQRLLEKISFSPSRDTLYLLGDLVNRGPASDAVLRRLMGYGASARCLLGNHDLHLLAVSYGARKPGRKDTLQCILQAPDRHAMLEWLRHQNMALLEQWGGREMLMVHAGVLPQWGAAQTLELAREVEAALRSSTVADFFATMYGNAPASWDEALQGAERLRVVVNALTRMRFCTPQGTMEFGESGTTAPPGYMPWFDVPGRHTAQSTVAFGHWSTLGHLDRGDVLSMDTGCVWGGCLSAMRVTPLQQGWDAELIQVQCEQAQKPGE
ncbi:symmetrical bis(5'-nucleosyl)-tetraphosphatase [Rhodoferax sp. GW822-FHT02A01]|uniref:symmetrical bis(5'-nucleosyl)-tetraphosphatase n=1 Tax=Rhodoferax sp. GW822-FHT02A01 TaxID=3141537 RepID=UPI00315C60BD